MKTRKNVFRLSKEKKYYIYGYTSRALRMAEVLSKKYYHFCKFIDKNAEQLILEHPDEVISLSELEINKKTVIIISLQSAVVQNDVAETLSAKGCKNIVFMAAGMCFSPQYSKTVRKVWEALDRGVVLSQIEIPCYKREREKEGVIEELEEHFVVWLPIELLYSKPKLLETELNDIEWISGEINIPVVCIERMYNFFECIIRYASSCSDYTEPYERILKIKPDYRLLERKRTLMIWEQELARGIDYFIDAAIQVVWNPCGYFNILDGVHRCLFLLYHGYNMIPAIVSKKDYYEYYNRSVIDRYQHKQIEGIILPHPIMYNDMIKNKERSYLWVRVMQILQKTDLHINSFIDIELKDGYWAYAFKRYGVTRVACAIKEEDKTKIIFGAALMHVNEIEIINYMGDKDEFDEFDMILGTDISIPIKRLKELKNKNRIIIYDCRENEIFDDITDLPEPFFYYIGIFGEVRNVFFFK